MGIKNLPLIAERLVAAGRDRLASRRPWSRAARSAGQRTVGGTLADIAARVEAAGVRPPAITVVGPVAELRETLAWLERRPLHGQVVAVTRARAQASELAERLRESGRGGGGGAGDPDRAAPGRAAPDRPTISSASRARTECDSSSTPSRGDARALAGARVAAIGPGTAAALRAHGIEADVVPERSVAEGLLEALADEPLDGKRVLVARAASARDVLPDGLHERGASVDVLALYETVAEPLSEAQTAALKEATYVTFTSSSTVNFFLSGRRTRHRRGACRLHRPCDKRDTSRARDRTGRGGRATRHRRAGGGSARGRNVIITLLTDYGRDDDFVGVCHGVIRTIHPEAQIVDLTHGVRRYAVRQGALVLRNTLPYTPVGVHLAMVDPQVGTERRAVGLRCCARSKRSGSSVCRVRSTCPSRRSRPVSRAARRPRRPAPGAPCGPGRRRAARPRRRRRRRRAG